jgi:hypothetical protein
MLDSLVANWLGDARGDQPRVQSRGPGWRNVRLNGLPPAGWSRFKINGDRWRTLPERNGNAHVLRRDTMKT